MCGREAACWALADVAVIKAVGTTVAATSPTKIKPLCRNLLCFIRSPKRSMDTSYRSKRGPLRGRRCQLRVTSRHLRCKKACPLYPEKQTSAVQNEMSAKGQ